MSNVISFIEYKNKKDGKPNNELPKVSDLSPEFQARLLRISLMVRSINETMAALQTLNTKKENK